MALTLDDIIAAPTDPDQLNKHLMDKGLLPQPPPPVTVGPLPPVITGNEVKPMARPTTLSPEESANIVAGANNKNKSWEIKNPDLGAAPDLGLRVPEVKPMTLPGAGPARPEISLGESRPVIPTDRTVAATAPKIRARGAVAPMTLPAREPTSPEDLPQPLTFAPVRPTATASAAPPAAAPAPAPAAEPGAAPEISGEMPVATMEPPAMPALMKPTKKESIEAGKREYAQDRPKITAEPGSLDYQRQKLARDQWDDEHPWGAPVSAQPGTLGKIGHIAAAIGQGVGSAIAPGIVEGIPGTRLNRAMRERGELGTIGEMEKAEREKSAAELQRQNVQSEIGLRTAQGKEAEAKAAQEGQPKTDEEKTVKSLMTGGPGGGPQINPTTNKPYTQLEAYGATKKAGEKTPEADRPLSASEISQGNAGNLARYRVLNPGKALPPEFTLPPNATGKDYDRIDKQLEATEKASMTKTQKDALDEQRKRAREDKDQQKLDKEEKEGREWVTGEDPNNPGQQVLVPLSQAKELGLKNQAKADNDTLNKTLAARHVEPLLYNNDPANPGIMQMIDNLEKKGKLGPLASRWNDFLARKWGGDDGDYAALRARMDLATTKLMQAHVGSRGGSFMLEHFEDIANAKKMSAANLRAGVDQELRYVHDISMNPTATKKPAEAKPAAAGGGGGEQKYTVGQIVPFKGVNYKFKGGDQHKKENWEKQ